MQLKRQTQATTCASDKKNLPMATKMVKALNRMQVDEKFRKEIAQKIF